MYKSPTFEFDCPQFYDFCNGVEENTKDIHNLGGDSPGFENNFDFKSKNTIANRFGVWNKKLSTPVNKSPFVNVHRQNNTTDFEKLEGKKRLSKSEECLNVARVKNFKKEYFSSSARKKSLSEGDLRPKKKFPVTPKRFPATPMCLKRTQKKDKTKKLKTTEELELETIAQLQSLTLKHLRMNEINMKRMNLKSKPSTIPKTAPVKVEKKEKSVAVKEFQKDLQAVIKKLDSKRNKWLKFQTPAKRHPLKAVSSVSDLENSPSHVLQALAVPGLFSKSPAAVDEGEINELSFKKYPAHSGLFFHMNHSKKAALKPFNFHDRLKDTGSEILSKSSIRVNKENMPLAKVKFSHSFHASHPRNKYDKENRFYVKMAPKTDGCIMKKTFKF